MSARKRSDTGDAEDLVHAPFLDEEERAESEWLLARDRNLATPAPSSKIFSDHAEIAELLASMPSGRADSRWQDEVLRKASALAVPWWRRPTLRWTMGGAVALAAAAAVAVLVLVPRPSAELEVAIQHGAEARALDEVVVGDRLVITARPRSVAELRVFGASRKLVARCPSGPACTTSTQGEYTLEVALSAPATYHVILAVGLSDAPTDETMDAYLDAARAANARIIAYPPIDVR